MKENNFHGKKILITEGDTPYGQALIQLLHRAISCNDIDNNDNSATVIYATTSKQENSNFLKFLGVVPLNTNKQPSQWLPTIENTIDICFDMSCSDSDITNFYESSRRCLKTDTNGNGVGQLICISTMNSIYSSSYLDKDYNNQSNSCINISCNNLLFGNSSNIRPMLAEMKAKYFMKNTYFYDIFVSCDKDPMNFKVRHTNICFSAIDRHILF